MDEILRFYLQMNTSMFDFTFTFENTFFKTLLL